jgi:hypothetical protein
MIKLGDTIIKLDGQLRLSENDQIMGQMIKLWY